MKSLIISAIVLFGLTQQSLAYEVLSSDPIVYQVISVVLTTDSCHAYEDLADTDKIKSGCGVGAVRNFAESIKIDLPSAGRIMKIYTRSALDFEVKFDGRWLQIESKSIAPGDFKQLLENGQINIILEYQGPSLPKP